MAQVQLTTDVKNYKYSILSVPPTSGTGSLAFPSIMPTRNQPISGPGHLFIGGNANYLKLQVYSEGDLYTANTACRIYGWNFCADNGGFWVPQIFYAGDLGVDGAGSISIPVFGSAQYKGRTFPAGQGTSGTDANVKTIFNSSANSFAPHIVIDCIGAQFVSIFMRSGAAGTTVPHHILYSSI